MATYDQLVTTYSDTTPHVRVIRDVIEMIDPRDTPLLSYLGLASANERFNITQNSYKIEWLEDSLEGTSSTANHGTTITTNTVSITVSDASAFQDGHVILIDSEYMVVSAVDATNNTITVHSRAYGGTNATHAATATIEIVGMARLEGDDADYVGLIDVTAPYNYTSIYQKGLKISGTHQVIDQYGKEDEFSYQAMKALPERLRLLNRSLYHGVRAAGSATTPRSMGGLDTFIGSNTVSAGGAIAKADVDGLAEQIHLDGGNPDLLVLHPSIANDLKALLDSSSFVRVDQSENRLGLPPMEYVQTQYGNLRILMDRWCPTATGYMLDSSKVGIYTLRPFAWKMLGDTGDSEKAELVGEFSMAVMNDLAHGTITGITT